MRMNFKKRMCTTRDKLFMIWRRYIFHPLSGMAILIVILSAILIRSNLAEKYEHFDLALLVFIVAVSLLVVLFMLIRTKWPLWNILAAGLLANFLFQVVLYGNSAFAVWREAVWKYQDDLLYVVRSGFIIGGLFVLVGLSREWWFELAPEDRHFKVILRHPILLFNPHYGNGKED